MQVGVFLNLGVYMLHLFYSRPISALETPQSSVESSVYHILYALEYPPQIY